MTVLFLSNLKQTIPSLIELISSFGNISGYKINNNQSVILYLQEKNRIQPPLLTPFSSTEKGFTYLGIKITPAINKLTTANYNPIVDSTLKSISRWTKLPISMIGKMNIIKISVLPKFLYLSKQYLSSHHLFYLIF